MHKLTFTEYVDARQPRLVRSAVLMGCDLHGAEDAVQSVLERIWPRWRRVSRMDSPDAYVYRALIRQVGRQRQLANRARPVAVLPEPDLHGLPGHDQVSIQSVVLRQALARLSTHHREVLVLRYFADLSEADTASALKIAPGTVKSRAARAIAHLSAAPELADYRPEHDEEHST